MQCFSVYSVSLDVLGFELQVLQKLREDFSIMEGNSVIC